ncbi:MAG: formate C-acetyltransferase/glycerol dehydratase family glycyl radical enzyme [Spirochaetales bacterium]|nr:MAG: formate C-acetyltransferase/glycerol dehydratase family glycyl radical enzyme [Spirochaetales bacterium]
MAQITVTGYTSRIQNLREEVLQAKSTICLDRARCYTEVYKNHPEQPVIIRRAQALSKTLRTMKIFLEEGTLLAGNQSSSLRAAPIFPEYAVEWIEKEIDEFEKRPGDIFYPSQQTKQELLEICAWWKGQTTLDKGRAQMQPLHQMIHETGIIRAEGNLTSGDAHIAVDNRQILSKGIGFFVEKVKKLRKECNVTSLADLKKSQFYEAVLLTLEAFQGFILRYADLAAEKAAITEDKKQEEELLEIERICRKIFQDPPESFHEAVQLTWFLHVVLQIESNGHSLSLGRLDQYLYPYYQNDIDCGKIDQSSAMELLENLWIKLMSVHKIRSWSHTRFSAGSPLYQNVTIGGKNIDGSDSVNDLSFLILHSVGETRLTQPNLSVRFHKDLSDEFLTSCLDVIRLGFGMPAFNNDEVVIPAFMDLGVEEADAYDYSAIGCIEVAVPGKWGYRCTGKHFLNFMRIFMAALNNGTDTESQRTFFPGNGTLADFKDYNDLLKAWDIQVRQYARAGIAIDTAIDVVLEEEAPDILCSTFVDNCLERGKTIHEGGSKYDFVSGLQVGIANLGDSLAAVKKFVFDEKSIKPEELMEALNTNFQTPEGQQIRNRLIYEAPKYGNDDDTVDLLLAEAYNSYIDEIQNYRTIREGRGPIGCRYYAGTSSISGNVPAGSIVPATPDGRLAYTPLAEGASPSAGMDTSGPTAVFQSIAKLPTNKILGGVLLNQKINPALFDEAGNKPKLVGLIRAFFAELKGWHVQYNVVSRETLIKAKENPVEYRDLVVRVAGYSAFFTTLSPEMQNNIIERTEQSI